MCQRSQYFDALGGCHSLVPAPHPFWRDAVDRDVWQVEVSPLLSYEGEGLAALCQSKTFTTPVYLATEAEGGAPATSAQEQEDEVGICGPSTVL